MHENKSPWVAELDHMREKHVLAHDASADVAIIGAGIAGMATSFFTLEHTNKSVALIEKETLASGASGHNAGLVVAGFERPLAELAAESNIDLAIAAQQEVNTAWQLLNEITDTIDVKRVESFEGYGGLIAREDCLTEMGDIRIKRGAGMSAANIVISEDAPFLSDIPVEYADVYDVQPHKDVLALLQTQSYDYHAAAPSTFAVLNSALLCQDMLRYLERTYPDRFTFFEHTLVSKVVLKEDRVLIDAGEHVIEAGKTILCTNGFEGLSIFNQSGLDIDTDFHHTVSGVVGYMVAVESDSEKPAALWYDMPPNALMLNEVEQGFKSVNPFLYLSRRPYRGTHKNVHGLVGIGGPETQLADRAIYDKRAPFPQEAVTLLNTMLEKVCGLNIVTQQPAFHWHGLMGYTPTGVRRVGIEPRNSSLLYNLGCNGIGIMPSIAGGLRIARLLNGEKLPPSLFDPVTSPNVLEKESVEVVTSV